MSVPVLTYTELTTYFRDVARAQTVPFSVDEISSALGGQLGSTSSNSGFNVGTSPVGSVVTASLTAAQASVSRTSATAARFDAVDSTLSQLGTIVGTLAPSAGGRFGDATTLPAVGTPTLPDTLQGNIDRAQRAIALPAGPRQAQEETAAQTRFSALRGQAQQLIGSLQGLHLSNAANQHAFDIAVGNLQAALASNDLDASRVRALSFSAATGGGTTSGGTFDASTSAGRAGARTSVDQLNQAIVAAQAALAPDRSTAHQQLLSAQSLVTQFTNLQSQVNNNSFSLGNASTGVFQLVQFSRSGLANFFV
jgi:hypothetical protein